MYLFGLSNTSSCRYIFLHYSFDIIFSSLGCLYHSSYYAFLFTVIFIAIYFPITLILCFSSSFFLHLCSILLFSPFLLSHTFCPYRITLIFCFLFSLLFHSFTVCYISYSSVAPLVTVFIHLSYFLFFSRFSLLNFSFFLIFLMFRSFFRYSLPYLSLSIFRNI